MPSSVWVAEGWYKSNKEPGAEEISEYKVGGKWGCLHVRWLSSLIIYFCRLDKRYLAFSELADWQVLSDFSPRVKQKLTTFKTFEIKL